MPKGRVTILKGIPAAGKTTWAREEVEKNPTQTVRVNKDDLRTMLSNGKHSKGNEKLVIAVRDAIIHEGLEQYRHVIVDDTNYHPEHEKRIREIADAHGATVTVKELTLSVEDAIVRDSQRPNPVGEEVIRRIDKQRRAQVDNRDKIAYRTDTLYAPRAIVCDLDGTLAHFANHRSPFNQERCDLDEINVPVLDLILAYSEKYGAQIIFVSGRDEKHREATLVFLDRCGFSNPYLYMRPAGDTRNDAIIKRELYDTYLAGVWDVRMVFDDRTRVIRMWRDDLKIPTMQVAWGDF